MKTKLTLQLWKTEREVEAEQINDSWFVHEGIGVDAERYVISFKTGYKLTWCDTKQRALNVAKKLPHPYDPENVQQHEALRQVLDKHNLPFRK